MSPGTAPSRFRLRILLICVLLISASLFGAATSLIVAWQANPNATPDLVTTPSSQDLPDGRRVRVKHWHGAMRDACNVVIDPPGAPGLTPAEAAGVSLPYGIWCEHLTDVQLPANASGRPFFNMQAAGWPLKCVA